MWADTLLQAERQHLIQLLAWAALSIFGGTAIGVLVVVRRVRSPLLSHFALQTALWGVVVGAASGVSLRQLRLRDYTAAAHLGQMLWFLIGCNVGFILVGVVLALAAWSFARRMSGIGAGIAIVVQGLGLLILNLQFAVLLSR